MKKYLIHYVKELHDHGLNDNFKKMKQLYKNLESFVEHYTIKHPYETSIILGGNKIADVGQKLDKINSLFTQYSSTSIPNLTQEVSKISTKLDFLIDHIDELGTQLSSHPVGNEIHELLTSVEKTTDDFDLVKENGKVNLPVIQPIEFFSTINTNIDGILSKISEDIKSITDVNDYNSKEKDISAKLIKLDSELDTGTKTISSMIHILSNEISSIRKTYKFTFNSADCNFVRTQEDFIKFIESDVNSNPTSKYKDMWNEYVTSNGKVKDNARIKKLIYQYNVTESFGSDKQYDGTNTHRIVNNFVINDGTTIQKIDLMQSILDSEYITYQDIYNPDLNDGKFSSGGAIQDLRDRNVAIGKKIEHFHELYSKYGELTKLYNKHQIDNTLHTMFLILIVTNQLFTQSYVIYYYVSKGLLTFYKRSIDIILDKIRKKDSGEIYNYFKKYHKVTLLKLQNFIDALVNHPTMSPTSIINIRKCKGETANRFMLFNYFKNILDSYKQIFQSKISIYARINDFGNIDKKNVVFSSDASDYQKFNVDNMNCTSTRNATIKYDKGVVFTEVFDTQKYPGNNAISKYMSIDSQLAKQKGVALLTYGYSGTGKTYTLFGKTGTEGILQAVLNDVVGIKQIKFRLFEIYGLGVPYSYYWTDDKGQPRLEKINHVIYNHLIHLSGNSIDYIDSLNKTEIINAQNISIFINCLPCTSTTGTCSCNYVDIINLNLEEVLKNFGDFMEKVDLHRMQEKRIRQTPNNNVSSRSILVYDFKIYLNNSSKDSSGNDIPTQFLIIDLPGREEILQTYIETYFENYLVMNVYRKNIGENTQLPTDTAFVHSEKELKVKMMLSSMALNPVGVSIYADDLMDEFNDLDEKYRLTVLNSRFDSESKKLVYRSVTKSVTDTILYDKINYLEDPITNRLSEFAEIKDNKIFVHVKITGFGFVGVGNNNYQYKALIGIYIMNHLLLDGKFDVIEKIFKKLIDKHFNVHLCSDIDTLLDTEVIDRLNKLKGVNFKGETITQYSDIFKKDIGKLSEEDKLYLTMMFYEHDPGYKETNLNSIFNDKEKLNKILLKKIYSYDYVKTPLEGVYINENIMGLLKYMIDNLSTKSKTSNSIFQEQQIIQQIPIDFNMKRDESRMLLANNINIGDNINPNYVSPDTPAGKFKIGKFFHYGNWNTALNETKFNSKKKIFYPEKTLADGTKVTLPVYEPETMDYIGSRNVTGTQYEIDIPKKLFDINGTAVKFIVPRLNEEYNLLKKSYRPGKLFNFEHPLIQDILSVYLKTITEYKTFYLFGNYNDAKKDLKCEHQINLLEQSMDFISDVENKNKELYNTVGKKY